MNQTHKKVMQKPNKEYNKKLAMDLSENDLMVMRRLVKNVSLNDEQIFTAFVARMLIQVRKMIADNER